MAIPVKKIFISDAVDESCAELLREAGFQVQQVTKLSEEQLIKEIQDVEALIVRSETKVKANVLNSAPKLRVVGRAGTGVDNIDVEAATKKGIIVLNTPGGNSISACELTCALVVSLARNVPSGCQSLKEGRWDRKLYTGEELLGKTLAVLGLGRIGREVASRMKAFGMRIIGFDPIVSAESAAALGIEKMELPEIWPLADYITVHTPLIPQTKNLINGDSLNKCKPGVKIINVARGGIVDEKALLEALKDGRCGGAAIDVFTEEPPKSEWLVEFIKHPKVIATPHLGASTVEAQQRVAVEIAEQLISIAKPGEGLAGVVNAPVLNDLRIPSNTAWINLGKELGNLVGRLYKQEPLKGMKIDIITTGLEALRFMKTSVCAGLMSGRTENGLNLINALFLAEEAGVLVTQAHNDKTSEPTVSIVISGKNSHKVSGTIRGGESWLMSIDDANFTSGVLLNSNTLIFEGAKPNVDCPNVIGTLIKNSIIVTNMAVARGKTAVWIVVQVLEKSNLPKIEGLKAF
ncbi:D-3-phosphoglycerate dehydrogenase [Halyomorpha halys]|uniref:D-3-phosphoglycerate dehydrogenase n=1 Tax=Halyomorpha halys TaxID=286706 RepID=UPI0006D4E600|nr:D-3-phosphoglycerate dehydrogenase [Halyomorpha halys]